MSLPFSFFLHVFCAFLPSLLICYFHILSGLITLTLLSSFLYTALVFCISFFLNAHCCIFKLHSQSASGLHARDSCYQSCARVLCVFVYDCVCVCVCVCVSVQCMFVNNPTFTCSFSNLCTYLTRGDSRKIEIYARTHTHAHTHT